jgi:hypothetical protein
MLQRICLVVSVCALAFFLGRGISKAGWDGLGLTTAHDASSLVISVKKKKKHHDDDDNNADNNDNGPETPKVDQASCAKDGLQYVAGAGDKCYCPNGLVNKATGLLVATHRSDCVTAESYNQLDSGDKVSDIRLKADIRRVGTTALNLPLYTFRYIGKDGQYEGVMAQDVLKVMPKAVSVGEDGYYRVNYGMLGIEMRRLD